MVNEFFLRMAVLSLNGNEKINGINPKLMKDIINHRHLLDEQNGMIRFREELD